MTHLEALEEVIKYQKEKLAVQEAEIFALKAEVQKAKAEPKIDYLSYLEKQKNCQHEFEQSKLTSFLFTSRKCKKCDYSEPNNFTNINPWQPQPFIGGGPIVSNPNLYPNCHPQQHQYAQGNQGNFGLLTEERRNRG